MTSPTPGFSDEDLAKLETMVLNCEAFYGIQPPLSLSALLRRLRAAESIVRLDDGLNVRNDRLCARRAFETVKIAKLIDGATADAKSDRTAGRMLVGRCDGLPPFVLTVAPLRYLGLIGSKAKVRRIFDALVEEGTAPQMLQGVHAPIGLDIGAITPQEIAVSIVAQLIAAKHGKISDPHVAAVSMRWEGALRK